MFCQYRQNETKRECERIGNLTIGYGKALAERQGSFQGNWTGRCFTVFGTSMEKSSEKSRSRCLESKAAGYCLLQVRHPSNTIGTVIIGSRLYRLLPSRPNVGGWGFIFSFIQTTFALRRWCHFSARLTKLLEESLSWLWTATAGIANWYGYSYFQYAKLKL